MPECYDLNQNLVEHLECPICMNYLTPPIYQCLNGHPICNNCKPNVYNCPTCKEKNIYSRMLILEKVYNDLRFPCSFKEFGCDALLNQKSLKNHEDDCVYQSIECPMKCGCSWKDIVELLYLHLVSDDHKDAKYVLVEKEFSCLSSHKFNARLNEDFIQHIVIGLKVFCLIIEFKKERILAGIKFYGPKSSAKKYKYKITITPGVESEESLRELTLTYSSPTHWYNTKTNLSDVDDECFNFDSHLLKKFGIASPDGYFGVNISIQEI